MAKIKEVRCIRTRQNGTWIIVKIITDQPGLYGIGSASEHNHAATVATALEESLGPLLIGREASRIEDIWQCVYNSGYWRNGSILNAALGGIDMALWDIKGKEAGMPVYELLGGACRAAVPCYAHAGGGDHEVARRRHPALHRRGLAGDPLPTRRLWRRRIRRKRPQAAQCLVRGTSL